MKKFLAIAATGAALAISAGAASAATCPTGDCGLYTSSDSQILTTSNAVQFALYGIGGGDFEYRGQFDNQATLPATLDVTVLAYQQTNLASINNLTISAYTDAGYTNFLGSAAITDDHGYPAIALTGSDVVYSGINLPTGPIYLQVNGFANLSGDLRPSVQFTIAAVPLPATGIMLLGSLGALGVAKRRKKKAANA